MIAIGSDHAGYELKCEVIKHLEEKGVQFIDCGCNGESVDYPDIAEATCKKVTSGECESAILICGTGVGISIAANKVNGVRAVVCSEPVTARLSKMHNDSNIVAFGARIVGFETAKAILDAFFDTEYEGGRHQKRIDMIHEIEERQ